ncbi:DUF2199 domain-containing protein [Flavobacterium pedocola]
MFWDKFRGNKKKEFKCETCGKVHKELPAIVFKAPFHYDALSEKDKNEIAEISDDFCVISYPEQTDRFIRTVLSFQINDTCESLDYGVWVSVSEKTFNKYESNFKKDSEPKTYFGMLCNDIIDYEESTLNLHVNIETQREGLRPEIIPHNSEHKLVSDWENGITIEEAENRIEKII